jgi:hypothetical protein
MADGLGDAHLLDEQKVECLGDARVLDEQKVECLGDACVLDEQRAECLVDDLMLDKHRVECLVDDLMLNEHRAECLVDDHKTAECLRYNPKADGYVNDYTTAECLVDDNPIGECLGNGSILSDEMHHGLVNVYPWCAKLQPCLVSSFNNQNHQVFSVHKHPALLNLVSPAEYNKAIVQYTNLKSDETSNAIELIDALMSILQL